MSLFDGPLRVWALIQECSATSEDPPCKHGNTGYCGSCYAESQPKCPHGSHGYCVYCEEDSKREKNNG